MADQRRSMNPSELEAFLTLRPYAVIHLDADWNGQRIPVQQRIDSLLAKIDDTSFGYIDIDAHPDHAKSIGLLNVPSCSYYRGATLVATVIGMQQDIEENLRIVRDGRTPDSSNRISRF